MENDICTGDIYGLLRLLYIHIRTKPLEKPKNKLASVGTIVMAIVGVVLPIIVLFMKR